MARPRLSRRVIRRIDELVHHFEENKSLFTTLLEQLRILFTDCKDLAPYIHSMKWRVKDPAHLKDKLIRKALEAKKAKQPFAITTENLFQRINDLAGFRILHLHTRQMNDINKAILSCLNEARYPIAEGPIAKTWDDETREYFQAIRIATEQSLTMYTSVHYVIASNSRTPSTCELQVRTLADEVWGEVDHTINYPIHRRALNAENKSRSSLVSPQAVLA
jgi:putative GTP pyrophosphokinase